MGHVLVYEYMLSLSVPQIFSWTVFPKKVLWCNFSIDDGNGSENVSFKMNSLFFNLCRVYSNLLKMASVGEFPWS